MRNYNLLGAGGTGSILFPLLVRYLETHDLTTGEESTITVIDGKTVSASKLTRQLFYGRYAGTNKAQALIEQYACDPNIIMAMTSYLNDDNISVIGNGDVTLIAADNFPVRARLERHILSLQNATVLNGGNEMTDGTLQIWVRRNGENITPPMSQGHPELLQDDGRDPAVLSCAQIAELPGGEQTIIANTWSAAAMLNGLRRVHEWEASQENTWPAESDEIFFDMKTFAMRSTQRPAPR